MGVVFFSKRLLRTIGSLWTMVKFIWSQSPRKMLNIYGAVFVSQASNQVHSRSRSTKFMQRFISWMRQPCSLFSRKQFWFLLSIIFKYLPIFKQMKCWSWISIQKSCGLWMVGRRKRRMIPCQRRETCVFDRLHREKAAYNRLVSSKIPKSIYQTHCHRSEL